MDNKKIKALLKCYYTMSYYRILKNSILIGFMITILIAFFFSLKIAISIDFLLFILFILYLTYPIITVIFIILSIYALYYIYKQKWYKRYIQNG